MNRILLFCITSLMTGFAGLAQDKFIIGVIKDKKNFEPIPAVSIYQPNAMTTIAANDKGNFRIKIVGDSVQVVLSATGYRTDTVILIPGKRAEIYLEPDAAGMREVVVTGTMRTVQKAASPVPVELYTPKFFLRNPTPTIFDALQMVNGVRPQLNCNVCNTGDIHMNGLEGPYTMVLIDGMPIMSALASVYGLSGIPNSLVERIEIVKGPASSLYGSEAIGGLINVITKTPVKAPRLSVDLSSTTWGEVNTDIGVRYRGGKKATGLFGLNYFNYSNPIDKNGDNFTDITLQNRISLFNKISWQRKNNRSANVALRYIGEDRWGGEMNWNKNFRGGDSVYGENVRTNRFELIGNYQLPTTENIVFSYSLNDHRQRSAYGTTIYNADQRIAFGQLTWNRSAGKHHNLLAGIVTRYTWYDDNTPATQDTAKFANRPDKILLPGIFLQDEININKKQVLLLGVRYDYDKRHGNIVTPRVAWKLAIGDNDILRLNAGTGFRVVNLFTEDHAALTGAREVIIRNELKPEKSYNANVNYVKKVYTSSAWINFDLSAWYTHFTNRIMPDYTTNPNQIIYDNLSGHSVSKGISLNTEMGLTNGLRGNIGFTLMDVSNVNRDGSGKRVRERQLITENWTGTWALSYTFARAGLSVDYTGNLYGPMKLPLLSELDPRPENSPAWSIQNIQFTKKAGNRVEIYGGVKNLLNWTPAKKNPGLIARAHDPFDKQVTFGADGNALPTAGNPYALTFDPTYVYAPNQGIRGYLGLRVAL
jgi:outer membrane receptor for ferrienterochelin and colicins